MHNFSGIFVVGLRIAELNWDLLVLGSLGLFWTGNNVAEQLGSG
jgi:hypothetical protein